MCAGFYVAVHPWLEAQSLHKVGHTGNLAARLHDGSYTTCFTDEWKYCFTLETSTKKDAQKIEAGVLYCAQFFRVKNKELVCLLPEKIKQLAEDVANCLDISYTLCDSPTYEMNDSTIVVEPSLPSDPLISKEKLRHLVITPVEDEEHFADDVLFFLQMRHGLQSRIDFIRRRRPIWAIRSCGEVEGPFCRWPAAAAKLASPILSSPIIFKEKFCTWCRACPYYGRLWKNSISMEFL